MLRKIFKIMKNNMLGFIVGAIIFSGITYAVAATIQSTNVSYTTSNNSSVSNVKQAVDELYGKANNSIQFKYWNASFDGVTYASQYKYNKPSSIYNSREELVTAYGSSNFNTNPFYIKSITIGERETAYLVCIYYNSKELCIDPFYDTQAIGSGDNPTLSYMIHTDLKTKLSNDIKQKLGITNPYCTSADTSSAGTKATCYLNSGATIGCDISWSNSNNTGSVSFFRGSFGSTQYANGYCISNCDTNGDGIPDNNATYNKTRSCSVSGGAYNESVKCQ